MKKATTKAIVLSRTPFGESDLYVQFLTRDWGVITALARAARKSRRRYVGGLDLFCHDEIFLRGDPRERPYLMELVVLNSFAALREDFERMMVAGRVVQWVRKLAIHASPLPGLYSLVGQTLAMIEKESVTERLELLTLVFRLKLLTILGLKPQLLTCVSCESPIQAPAVFDIQAGGTACLKCRRPYEETFALEPEDHLLLRRAEAARFSLWQETEISMERVKPALALITQFTSFHSQSRLPL